MAVQGSGWAESFISLLNLDGTAVAMTKFDSWSGDPNVGQWPHAFRPGTVQCLKKPIKSSIFPCLLFPHACPPLALMATAAITEHFSSVEQLFGCICKLGFHCCSLQTWKCRNTFCTDEIGFGIGWQCRLLSGGEPWTPFHAPLFHLRCSRSGALW